MGNRLCRRTAIFGTFVAGLFLAVPSGVAQTARSRAADATASSAAPKIPELDEAFKLFGTGDSDAALERLEVAVKKHPELPPARMVLAAWLVDASQPAMARSVLEQAIREAPEDPEPYVLLGDIALRNQQLTEAGLLFDKGDALVRSAKINAQRLASVKRRVLAGLVTVAEARRDWKRAERYLKELLTDEPKNAAALAQLGRVLFHEKRADEALAKLQEAAKLDRTVLTPEAQIAQLYQDAGDKDNAGKHMVAALKANPRDVKTRLVAAQWAYELGDFDQAETQAAIAVQLNPESLDAHLIRGVVGMMRKDFKTAEDSFEKAHLLSPSNLLAIGNLVLALAEQDDAAKRRLALEYAQIAARLFPDQPESAATLGWAYYKQGRLDEAEVSLRKALGAARPTPEMLYFTARVLVDRGRKQDAIRLLQSPAMKSPAPFYLRNEAKALLEELSKG